MARIVNFLRVALLVLAAGLLIAPAFAVAEPVRSGENGSLCHRDADCLSWHCADGRRCAPQDKTGAEGAYCHHDNHCASGRCSCNHGMFGFCRDWESWPAGRFSAGYYGRYLDIGLCE